MCQAIAKPEGMVVGRKVLGRAWDENPDGAGFAYLENGKVTIRKGFFSFGEFWKAYREHRLKACLIHFRWATHGVKSVDNCHPFEVVPDVALIHNGVMAKFEPPVNSDLSDTRYFVNTYLTPYIPTDLESAHATMEHNKSLIESVIDWSKLAVLTPKGFIFYNERWGEWVNGIWYSAGYPKKRVARWVYKGQSNLLPYGSNLTKWNNWREDTWKGTSEGPVYQGRYAESSDTWADYYAQCRQAELDDNDAYQAYLKSKSEEDPCNRLKKEQEALDRDIDKAIQRMNPNWDEGEYWEDYEEPNGNQKEERELIQALHQEDEIGGQEW